MKSIKIGKRAIPIWAIILVIVIATTTIVTATYLVGQFKIGYRIEPTTPEAVTLNPSPIILDLGTLPSGSTGKIDFGNCCRLNLSAGYTIFFALDETTIQDFDRFEVRLEFHEVGTTYIHHLYLGPELDYTRPIELDDGNYDLHVEVEYKAKHLTETTTGEVKITISY